MKKSGKRLILATAVFSAALNMNGCVYGAPPYDASYVGPTEQSTEQKIKTSDNDEETEQKIGTSDNEGETDARQGD